MSILLIFENKDPEPWKKKLKEALPSTKIEVYPNVEDPSSVAFIICWKPKENVFTEFPNLKVIQSVGASIDHIISAQSSLCKDKPTTIITRIVDENLSHDMWEFLLSVVLMQLKNTKTYREQQEAKVWKQKTYGSINETTVSILGLGKIGGYCAQKFSELGFKVKGWSNSPKTISGVKSFEGIEQVDNFLIDSDFLINILPLTPQTRNILNEQTLSKLPAKAFLINVGRGEHLVESDLIKLLDSSLLSGALLDVFQHEPLPKEHPFWLHPKIQVTPHIASITNIDTSIVQVVENYHRYLKKQELLNTVSLTKGY